MGILRHWAWAWTLALLAPAVAHAQVDLTTLDRDMVGEPARVLVLGTTHLRDMPDDFDPASLDGLLDRLAAFRPDIITIESLPGEECDMVARFAAKYGDDFCASTEVARAATGLDIPTASARVDAMLDAWPERPTAMQRRHLAASFLAAGDRASAYVQWLQLPSAERHAGDGLDAALVALLQDIAVANNEAYQVAARLAARLGLQRVFPIDNHTGDNVDVDEADVAAFGQALRDAWNSERAELSAREKRQQALAAADDLLPLYRYINDPVHLQALANVNVHATMSADSPEGYPRIWVGGWEVRNLRMVANIRKTFQEDPDARVLSIVGASHKPWFDAWLGQLQGVEIVDAEQVLAQPMR
jgi:hypothetical protein